MTCRVSASRSRIFLSVAGPTPWHRAECPLARRAPELVWGFDAKGCRDLDHPLGCNAEHAPQADQLGSHIALQLVELRDGAGARELGEPCRDPPGPPRAVPGRGPAARARESAPASRGSSPRLSGKRATCTGTCPPGRGARRRPRAVRRPLRCRARRARKGVCPAALPASSAFRFRHVPAGTSEAQRQSASSRRSKPAGACTFTNRTIASVWFANVCRTRGGTSTKVPGPATTSSSSTVKVSSPSST